MEVEEILLRRPKEGDIARVLLLVSEPPNPRGMLRPGDLPGSFDFWFDGGAARIVTGWTVFEFKDGTRATLHSLPSL